MGEPAAVKRYSLRTVSNPSLGFILNLVLHSARLYKADLTLFRNCPRWSLR